MQRIHINIENKVDEYLCLNSQEVCDLADLLDFAFRSKLTPNDKSKYLIDSIIYHSKHYTIERKRNTPKTINK